MINDAQTETNTRLYDRLLDANNLIESFNNSKKDVCWKESVQRYESNLLRNVNHTIKELKNNSYEQKPFYEFPLMERGKRRHVKSLHISDRVVNRAVCDYILYPSLQNYLIYDNGASVKGKGIGFTRSRLDCHLHKYYAKYKTNEGYILLIDFSKFFDNIDHGKLLEYISEKIDDERAMALVTYLIGTFRVDVSYMSDEEFKNCRDEVFNSLRYSNEVSKEQQTGEKFMDKSLGIGSQISQISGIFYPTKLDNYCKIVKGCHFYGRYMDDTYVISNSKEYLQQLIVEIIKICDEMGIHVNQKKTQICKLTDFTFLKTKYTLTDTGKILHRMPHDNIVRERRKLKTLNDMVNDGRIPYQDARTQYGSWRGNAKHYDAYNTIQSMDSLYNRLFIDPFISGDTPHPSSRKRDNSHKGNEPIHRGSNKKNIPKKEVDTMRDVTQLHPTLQQKAKELLALCEKNGIRIKIGECVRTVAEQDALYAQGRTKPGNKVTNARGSSYSSMHQWGIAFDFFLDMDIDGDGSKSDDAFNNKTKMFNKVGALGKSIGLEWGGDWKSIVDLPHFQLPNWGSTATKLKNTYGTPEKFRATWGNTAPTTNPNTSSSGGYSVKDFVKDVQSVTGSKVDGIPGKETLGNTITVSAKVNKKHPVVAALQKRLNALGYNCGTVDCVAGAKFTNAVNAYQKNVLGYRTVDGEITRGGRMWKSLLGMK